MRLVVKKNVKRKIVRKKNVGNNYTRCRKRFRRCKLYQRLGLKARKCRPCKKLVKLNKQPRPAFLHPHPPSVHPPPLAVTPLRVERRRLQRSQRLERRQRLAGQRGKQKLIKKKF